MKIHKIILVILFFQSHFGISQTDWIHHCTDSDGWCGEFLKVHSDSSFIHTSGCEGRQSIQVGKMVSNEDTIILRKCELIIENFIDSVVFIQNNSITDTIDVFYFDKYGELSYSEEDFITYADSAKRWLADSNYDCSHYSSRELHNFNRLYETYLSTGEFLDESDRYRHSHRTYVVDSTDELALILRSLSTWINSREVISIPKYTKEIKIYYSFPSEIISILNFYYLKLRHSGKKRTWTCNDNVFTWD